MTLTESTRGKDVVECLTYLMMDVGKEITELASELAMKDGDVVGVCLCLKAEGVFDLENLSVVGTGRSMVLGKRGYTHLSLRDRRIVCRREFCGAPLRVQGLSARPSIDPSSVL